MGTRGILTGAQKHDALRDIQNRFRPKIKHEYLYTTCAVLVERDCTKIGLLLLLPCFQH